MHLETRLDFETIFVFAKRLKQVEYIFPPVPGLEACAVPPEWQCIQYLAMPEGSHNSDEGQCSNQYRSHGFAMMIFSSS